ncbi:glycosyltransferase, partial [Kordiimonas sp.]|uniref:glycosyltransferase n=1 Tax=Kordiimonas sp. TaxID=1970157 RepID=UPI003A8F08CB
HTPSLLNIYHNNWFGIRSATAAMPGQKLLINPDILTPDHFEDIARIITESGVSVICFQGFSEPMAGLATYLKEQLGNAVRLFAVSHVTSTQFQAPFEVRMQAALVDALKQGVLERIGSVKPHFHEVVPHTWGKTLINFCPTVPRAENKPDFARVFIPVENHWRKGLYTNLIAALRTPGLDTIRTVHEPKHLELLEDLGRVSASGFLASDEMMNEIAAAAVVMNVSLAECQPMTQLEAFAIGRPCLTGPLGLEEFSGDELIRLCTVERLDTPHEIIKSLEALLHLWRSDADAMTDMIHAHVERRNTLAFNRLNEFLEG